MFLSLVKKSASHFHFTVLSYVQGALQTRVLTTYLTENFEWKTKKHYKYQYSVLYY